MCPVFPFIQLIHFSLLRPHMIFNFPVKVGNATGFQFVLFVMLGSGDRSRDRGMSDLSGGNLLLQRNKERLHGI